MPGVGLGGGEATLGVHRADCIELGKAPSHDAGAGAGERGQCAVERGSNRRVHVHRARRFPEPPGATRPSSAGSGSDRRFTGQHCIDNRAASNARRQRPNRIQARRQRQHAGNRHTARRRLVADDAAERRRDATGSAGVGAEPGDRHAVGYRDGGAGRTAAGNTPRRAIPGRARRAVMRIDPEAGEGELGHVGAAQRNKAGGQHPLHHGRVRRGGRRIGQRARAGRRRLAGDVEQVLQADRNAGVPARARGRRGAARPSRPPSRAPDRREP